MLPVKIVINPHGQRPRFRKTGHREGCSESITFQAFQRSKFIFRHKIQGKKQQR